MIFSLDLRRARKGDCFLLHYGTRARPGLMVVDGGPANVYGPSLKPRLQAIRDARIREAKDPLPIDVLLISHIDDDHICGVQELLAELVQAKDARQPLPFRIGAFWHNTFDDILGNSPRELLASVTGAFGAASLAGDPDVEGLDPAAAQVLASVSQGIRVRDDARRLGLRVNPPSGGRLLMAAAGTAPVTLSKGLSVTIAGPMQPELEALQKAHDAFLTRAERTPAALAAFSDTSVPNLSSVVLLAEVKGKRMLLTGDARGDRILEGLELVGALPPGGRLHVDVLKMPHHGSDRNMAPVFLERIHADHYVFSGDGEHGNPEREVMAMLQDARPTGDYLIHLTYPIAEIDAGRKADWEKEQAKERTRRRKNPRTVVRDDWSPALHGLTAFFDAHPEMAARVRIVPEQGAHLIELLEPVRV